MTAPPCADGPEVFFADSEAVLQIAKRVCWSACRVRMQCLAAGLRQPEHGVWGGYTEQERAHLVRSLPGRALAEVTR